MGPTRQRVCLAAISLAVMAADLLLVHNGKTLTWWRLLPPIIGIGLILLSTAEWSMVLGLRRLSERKGALLLAVAIMAVYLWLTQYPSPFQWTAVDCRLDENRCSAPYWMAMQIRQLTVLAPLVEEGVYRAVGFGALALAIGPIPALFISAAAFGYLHHLYHIFHWWHPVAGVAYGLLFWYGRSLALNIATHSALNWAVMLRSLMRWYSYYSG
jgi:membrane protease YdiL (CAAX protease family)